MPFRGFSRLFWTLLGLGAHNEQPKSTQMSKAVVTKSSQTQHKCQRPQKAHFFWDYGVYFKVFLGSSWPGCSQRTTKINTNVQKKVSFSKSFFYWHSGTPSGRRVCGLETIFASPIACRPGASKSTFGNDFGRHLSSPGLLLECFRLPWKLLRVFCGTRYEPWFRDTVGQNASGLIAPRPRLLEILDICRCIHIYMYIYIYSLLAMVNI